MAKDCRGCGSDEPRGERRSYCDRCRLGHFKPAEGRFRMTPAAGDTRTLEQLVTAQNIDMRRPYSTRGFRQRFRDANGLIQPVMVHHGVAVDTADQQACTEWDDPVFDAVCARMGVTDG